MQVPLDGVKDTWYNDRQLIQPMSLYIYSRDNNGIVRCQQLQFATAKLRDTLVSWLGQLWHEELERGWVQSLDSDVFMRKICELRGVLAQLSDMQDMQISQMVRVMMVVVTNILLGLALIGYPTKMYEQTTECFQFWPLVASYLYFICYRGMLHVMFILDKGPFYAKGDCVNIDALLVSTERFVFHVFRTSFRSSEKQLQFALKTDLPFESEVWLQAQSHSVCSWKHSLALQLITWEAERSQLKFVIEWNVNRSDELEVPSDIPTCFGSGHIQKILTETQKRGLSLTAQLCTL